jgi:hypothetical protein
MAYSRTTKTNQACEKYGENYWFSPYKFTLSEIYRTNMAAKIRYYKDVTLDVFP